MGYSLQYVNTHDSSNCYPKIWEFSASNDPEGVFTPLHTQSSTTVLKDNLPHIFTIPEDKIGIYTSFKLTNKGTDNCGQHRLFISEIEFFGTAYFTNNNYSCRSSAMIFSFKSLLCIVFFNYSN